VDLAAWLTEMAEADADTDDWRERFRPEELAGAGSVGGARRESGPGVAGDPVGCCAPSGPGPGLGLEKISLRWAPADVELDRGGVWKDPGAWACTAGAGWPTPPCEAVVLGRTRDVSREGPPPGELGGAATAKLWSCAPSKGATEAGLRILFRESVMELPLFSCGEGWCDDSDARWD
jgi:hypothetical protein